MRGDDPMAEALRAAFNALIEVNTPERVVPVLRQAVTALLAEEPVSGTTPRPSKRSRSRWTGNLATWAPLRERILAVLAARGISRRELAAAVKIPHGTLKPALLPKGRAPGKANIARLERWLEAMEAREDGAADDDRPSDAASRPAYRLTTAQREKLAAYRQLDEQTARNQAGVTLEVIDEAVAGHSLAPEIVGRLVNFLQQQQPVALDPYRL